MSPVANGAVVRQLAFVLVNSTFAAFLCRGTFAVMYRGFVRNRHSLFANPFVRALRDLGFVRRTSVSVWIPRLREMSR
jgi:hypothetical protein